MKKYTNWAVLQFDDSLTGNAQESAQVKVYLAGTTTEAAIFSDVSGTAPIVQPILTNTTAQENPGRFEFYSAGGLFDIVINEGAADETKIEDVSISTEVNVKDFGAVGDGVTDDSAAFQAAQSSISATGGVVVCPPTLNGYVLGDGATTSTNIEVGSNIEWKGFSTKLINKSKNASGQPRLFSIKDVSNVIIDGFEVTSESTSGTPIVGVAVSLEQIVTDIIIKNCHFYDMANFAIQYADSETDPAQAYFTNVKVQNIKIDGDTGLVGAGSGINFFPRTQNGTEPASSNLWIENCYVDVSRGEAAESNHGPQAYKVNNVDGVFINNCVGRGGDISNTVITNGCRNVSIDGLDMKFSNRGIMIDSSNNVATTLTSRISANNLFFDEDGVSGGDDAGIYISGMPDGVQVSNYNIVGDVVIDSETTTDNLQGLSFKNGTITTGNFKLNDPGSVTNDVEGLLVDGLTLIGDSSTGQINLRGGTNRETNNSIIKNVFSRGHKGFLVNNGGDNNSFKNITSFDGNVDSSSTAAIVANRGSSTSCDNLNIAGSSNNVNYWVRSNGGSGLNITNSKGTPNDNDGYDFVSLTTSPTGDTTVTSKVFDLSGALETEYLLPVENDLYLLGYSVLYTEATSADSGILLRIGNDVSATALDAFTTETSKSVGDITQVMNTTEIANRETLQGNFITVRCDGGKTGTGEARVTLYLSRAV